MEQKSLFMLPALFVLIALSCAETRTETKETTRYYLLRHAEKAVDGTDDPDLSPEGQARALKLVTMLKDHKIDRLYATAFKRTQQTLQPLADKHLLKINIYDHQDTSSVRRMIADCKGKTTVIAGHSNSIPGLANKLIGQDIYQDLEDIDYSKMWEILFTGNRVTKHELITY